MLRGINRLEGQFNVSTITKDVESVTGIEVGTTYNPHQGVDNIGVQDLALSLQFHLRSSNSVSNTGALIDRMVNKPGFMLTYKASPKLPDRIIAFAALRRATQHDLERANGQPIDYCLDQYAVTTGQDVLRTDHMLSNQAMPLKKSQLYVGGLAAATACALQNPDFPDLNRSSVIGIVDGPGDRRSDRFISRELPFKQAENARPWGSGESIYVATAGDVLDAIDGLNFSGILQAVHFNT